MPAQDAHQLWDWLICDIAHFVPNPVRASHTLSAVVLKSEALCDGLQQAAFGPVKAPGMCPGNVSWM